MLEQTGKKLEVGNEADNGGKGADAPDFDRLTKNEYLILIQLIANALDEANSLQLSCRAFNDNLRPLVEWVSQLTTEGKVIFMGELIQNFI